MKPWLALAVLLILVACGGSSVQDAVPAGSDGAFSTSTTSTTSTTSSVPDVVSEPAEDQEEVSQFAGTTRPLGSALLEPAPEAAPEPIGLAIEAIGVASAPVIGVGVESNGEMEIPGASEVGWYRFGPTPGEQGSAVLAAHIAFNGRDGVFRDLDDIDVGAIVEVQYDDGSSRRFRVFETAQYEKNELPIDRIFAKEGSPELTLITCGGDFNRSLRSYSDNVVAYAEPIDD